MQVRWLRKARENLEDAAEYLHKKNPAVASEFVLEVSRMTTLLGSHPDIGRPGRVMLTRELVINPFPFIIPYRVTTDEVHILRVFHTRQRLPAVW